MEYVQNLSDKDGNRIDPTSVGMPDNFPEDTKTIATFKDLGNEKTEVTITEFCRLERENERLKAMVGELTMELKCVPRDW